jgi:hypothetical protein
MIVQTPPVAFLPRQAASDSGYLPQCYPHGTWFDLGLTCGLAPADMVIADPRMRASGDVPRALESRFAGDNLLQPHHAEFASGKGLLVEIKHGIYGKITLP